MNRIAIYLNKSIDGVAYSAPSILEQYATDRSMLKIHPRVVALPENTMDIRRLVRFSYQLSQKKVTLPITVRGSGYSKTGSDIGSGLIISTERMSRIQEIDIRQRLVRVQCGVKLGELKKALNLCGLDLPVMGNPFETIGGLIAKAASASNNTEPSTIHDFIDRAEVVLSDGTLIEARGLSNHYFRRKKLKEEGLPVFVYTSKAASPTNKEVIKLNFDAGIAQQNQKDDYQILIATDAISEGYNLHRAGTIYNYDIPYNPTRVIQRVGRINRINKKVFKELYIYNYFPTHIGEAETSVKEISTLKMAMIHAIMGEDTKYLTNDEELQNYFEKQYKELFDNEEDESWDTTYRALLDNLMNTNEMAEALKLPLRSKVRRLSTVHPNGVIAFARKNGDYVFKFVKSADEQETLDPSMAFEIIKAEPDEKGYQLSKDFNKLFDKAKHSLFVQETESEKDKTKRDALDKIRLIIKQQSCDLEYLEELQKAIELDAIAGYSLRQINRLRKKDFPSLPDIISRDYVESVLHNFDNISHGVETLIMAEEIDNKHESSTSEQA